MPNDAGNPVTVDTRRSNDNPEEALLEALESLIAPRILCTNMVRDLETIHALQANWPANLGASMAVRMSCEHAASECTAVVQILDIFISHLGGRNVQNAPPELPMLIEADVRADNALQELQAIARTIRDLSSAESPTDLDKQEMLLRSERAEDNFKRLGPMFENLQSDFLTSPWWQSAFER